jgi:predicted deacylase
MVIDKQKIELGETKLIKLGVSKLPSGTPININAHVFRSKNEGPTLLVLGGLHGDEINGVETVRRAIVSNLFNELEIGTVIAIPLLNVYGFINFSRDVPDGKDINRSFPGNSAGSLASRVAKKLTKEILPHVNFGLDFHTGGASIYNVPQIRVDFENKKSVELANAFGADFIVNSRLIARSLRKECSKKEIPMLVFEGGESLRLDENSINVGIKGIKNILIHKKMIKGVINPIKGIVIKENNWIRANASGVFVCRVKAGELVRENDVLGEIATPYNTLVKQVVAKRTGYIYGVNNNPVVNQGDALFHIGK